MKREVEKGISQPPKLALHPGVINDISTAELTQVLHANRRKAVTLKSSKNLNVPMKAIVTNPLNGLKNSAIMKNRHGSFDSSLSFF